MNWPNSRQTLGGRRLCLRPPSIDLSLLANSLSRIAPVRNAGCVHSRGHFLGGAGLCACLRLARMGGRPGKATPTSPPVRRGDPMVVAGVIAHARAGGHAGPPLHHTPPPVVGATPCGRPSNRASQTIGQARAATTFPQVLARLKQAACGRFLPLFVNAPAPTTGKRVCIILAQRGMAQTGSALRSGRRGPGFKSLFPDLWRAKHHCSGASPFAYHVQRHAITPVSAARAAKGNLRIRVG
jgi:hypothetical protein